MEKFKKEEEEKEDGIEKLKKEDEKKRDWRFDIKYTIRQNTSFCSYWALGSL